MRTASWKDIAELVGISAIVASLVFVGVQVRLDREIAVAAGNLANAANSIEQNGAILEHSDVWARGTSGDQLDADEAVVFRFLVKNTYDVALMEITRLNRLGDDAIARSVAADFANFLFTNPGARAEWAQQYQEKLDGRQVILGNDASGGAIERLIFGNLAKLDQSQD